MKMPSFVEGVLVAFVAAVSGAAFYAAAILVVPFHTASVWLVIGLGLGYALYLTGRADPRRGRLLMILSWVILTAVVGSVTSDLRILFLAQCVGLWSIRSLSFHSGPIAAAMDLGLILVGGLIGFWALLRTGSPFISIWSLFLVQALFAAIPRSKASDPVRQRDDISFERAERVAERALRRLSRCG